MTNKLTESPFFRASCGCIGLAIGPTAQKIDGQDYFCLIKGCDDDHDDDSPTMNICRAFDPDKTYTPLTAEETESLIKKINTLIHKGHRLCELRWIIADKRGDE